MSASQEFTRDDVANLDDVDKPTMASFGAKIIYVGTYGFEPQDDVLFTSRGIRLTAPSMKRPGELVVLNIHKHEVIRTVYHFSSKCCVIFLYVVSSCSEYVRDEIGMEPNGTKGYFSSPFSNEPAEKRITIQLESITEPINSVIKSIFSPSVLEEIMHSEANTLLKRVTYAVMARASGNGKS